jgi:hypothetical protein
MDDLWRWLLTMAQQEERIDCLFFQFCTELCRRGLPLWRATLGLEFTPARKIPRSIYEHAREVARALAGTPAYERSRQGRKRIEMLFAHLKRILKMGRLRLRGPCGAQDELLLAATAQNLRKLAKLVTSPGPQVMLTA